jgi:hypothetical protein
MSKLNKPFIPFANPEDAEIYDMMAGISKEDILDMEYFLDEFDDDNLSNETVTFKCLKCCIAEEIPKNIVDMMDREDPGDRDYPPQFDCEKCNGKMSPVYYKAYDGRIYKI